MLEISSTNFGALAPGGVINSSVTASVAASTLTVAMPDANFTTNYYRVSSLNWQGRKNTLQIGKMNFQIWQSTYAFNLGGLDGVITSTVSTSSMVIVNVGELPATFVLSAATATVGGSLWSLAVTRDIEVAVLQAVWNSGPPAPPATAFTTFLTTRPAASGGPGGDYAGDQNGFVVPTGQQRTLWFRFFAPTSTSVRTKETIQVTVQAVKP